MSWLTGKKTYIVGIVTIIYAIAVTGWQGGDWQAAFTMILAALGGMGLRAGVSKAVKK